ncbi:Protein phosphatase 1 regulatory subunit 37, partial [Eumeta japonica]
DAGANHIANALVEQAARTPPSAATSPLSPHHCPGTGGYEGRGLAVLVLWNNQLTRNGANHLGRALRSSSSLCVLNVGRNALGAKAVRALRSLGALACLGLQAARLGADAARPLADMIRARTQLQRLDLRDNRLGGAGLQAILAAMRENTTLTQIDLDDDAEWSSSLHAEPDALESAERARLAREIRALCRRNEPAEPRPHRKISLTCHSACLARVTTVILSIVVYERISTDPDCSCYDCAQSIQSLEEERRREKLRSPSPSPAPSPAGSPVPHHSRFSIKHYLVCSILRQVTPVNDRDSVPASPRPSPSRFRVVQWVSHQRAEGDNRPLTIAISEESASAPLASLMGIGYPMEVGSDPWRGRGGSVLIIMIVSEPPSIQVNSMATSPKPVKSSRFSVTRNYDTAYNTKSIPVKTVESNNDTGSANLRNSSDSTDESTDAGDEVQPLADNKYEDKTEEVTHKEELTIKGDDRILSSETRVIKNSTEVSDVEKTDVQIEVTLKKERIADDVDSSCNVVNSVNNDFAKVHTDQNDECGVNVESSVVEEFKNIDDINLEHNEEVTARDCEALKQIEALTEDLGNLIQEMKDRSKTSLVRKQTDGEREKKEIDTCVKSDGTQTDILDSESIVSKIDPPKCRDDISVPVSIVNEHNLALKKNKSESSLDSPDLEVSRLMNRKETSAFCDSSSSLEISGSSIESLNTSDLQQNNISRIIISQPEVQAYSLENTELDRRKPDLSTESSLDSNTSEITPVNTENFLNTSISSNESVSPIIFGKRKLHGSISSLEASVSSLDSARGENKEKVMVTSADSGIEHSLHQAAEANPESHSSNGTLTNNFSTKENLHVSEEKRKISGELFQNVQDTLTLSPKRTSSLLDVPALKNKSLERMRKISWVAPSSSFHIPKPEPEPPKVESKLSSNLEKLLSLFHHPSSLFSRSQSDDEKKSSTPPRKDSSSLAGSFWVWTPGYTDKVERDPPTSSHDGDSSPENATDSSTLSERVQVSFVDESFSKRLESKTPSTDTDNTLSEFHRFP